MKKNISRIDAGFSRFRAAGGNIFCKSLAELTAAADVCGMKINIDADIRSAWNGSLIHGDITKIFESGPTDPETGEKIISIDKIRRALSDDAESCDENVLNLINKYFNRRRMKLAKAKQKLNQ